MKQMGSKRILAFLMAVLLTVNNLSSLATYASEGEELVPAAEQVIPAAEQLAADPEPVVEPAPVGGEEAVPAIPEKEPEKPEALPEEQPSIIEVPGEGDVADAELADGDEADLPEEEEEPEQPEDEGEKTYTVTEASKEKGVLIEWNDNANEKGRNPASDVKAARPTKEAYEQDHLVLQVNIDGTGWVNLTADDTELLKKLGYEDGMPKYTLDVESNAQKWNLVYGQGVLHTKITEVEKHYEYNEETKEWEDKSITTEYTAQYRIVEKAENPIYGYMASEYFRGTNTEPEAGLPDDCDPTRIFHTAQITYESSVYWYDNKGIYETRPSESAFHLYRYTNGQDMDKAADITGQYPLIKTDVDHDVATEWEFTIQGAPAFDKDGNPYFYYVKPIIDELSQNTDAGVYHDSYLNTGNDSNITDAIMNHGELEATIYNTTQFKVTKVWEDEGIDPSKRPKLTLYLARIAENPQHEVVVDKLANSGAVEGHDKLPVPRKDDEGYKLSPDDFDGKDAFLIDFTANELLPMYDTEGRKYIYYVQEIGDFGPYIQRIDNAGAKDTGIDLTTIGQFVGTKYVLNNGKLINDRESTFNMAATKQFQAQALQSMAGTKVTYKLEMNYDGRGWVDATDKYIENKDELLSKGLHFKESADDEGNIKNTVLMDITGFSNEEMTKTSPAVNAYKYDPDTGAAMEYRWVEVSMSINGGDPVDTLNEDGSYKSMINTGDVMPGVGGENTTALFTPVPLEDNRTVVNKLHAETQVRVFKTWSDKEGNPITDDPQKIAEVWNNGQPVTLTFTLKRNEDGASTANGTLKDVNGNTVENLTITCDESMSSYDAMAKAWTGLWADLPRFAEDGTEYTYKINESEGDWVSLYSHEMRVVPDDDDQTETVKVTEQDAFFANGPDPGMVIGVQKKWLDGSDLISRMPVEVGVFLIDDPHTMVGSAILDESNGYWELIRFTPVEGHTSIDEYVVKELSVGGVSVADSTDLQTMWNRADEHKSYKNPANAVGEIYSESANALYYNYHVYLDKENGGSVPVYTVYNQKWGVEEIHLTKNWVAGSHKGLASVFRLYRDGKEVDLNESGINVHVGEKSHGGTIVKVNADGSVHITAPEAEGKYSCTLVIEGLPKYDEEGMQYTYKLVEDEVINGVHTETAALDKDSMPNVQSIKCNNAVTIGKDSFNIEYHEESKTIKGKDEHHTGDVYKWVANNTLGGSYDLSANKVWRDDNDIQRPDVTFDVYRVCEKDFPLITQYLDGADGEGDLPLSDEFLNLYLTSSEVRAKWENVAGRRLWDTTHNAWYWSVDLGSFAKYNGEGFRYVYFLTENYESYQGLYRKGYYNGSEKPKDGVQDSSKEVLGVPKSGLDTTVCLLADGKNDYSRTTVNYREDNRTISGRKIWKLPDGWNFTLEELPEVKLSLYRTTDRNFAEEYKYGSYTQTYAVNYIKENPDKVELAYVFDLKDGKYDFLANKDLNDEYLKRFDDFGRRYDYFLVEGTEEDDFAYLQNYFDVDNDVRINAYTFQVENTYTYSDPFVKVNIDKDWSKGSNVTDEPSAYFRVRLYGITGSNDPILMGYAILHPGEKAVSFEHITGNEFDILHPGDKSVNDFPKLPYYGPDQKPIVYYVTESKVNGYITNLKSGTNDDEVHSVVLTKSGDTYSGTVAFENNYDGDTVDLTIEKVWANMNIQEGNTNTGLNNNDYKPDAMIVTIYRTWADATIEGTEFKGGDTPVSVGGIPLQVELNSTNGYKAVPGTGQNQYPQLKGLPKYAPNGQPYKYYVQAEVGKDSDAQDILKYNFTISVKGSAAGGNTITPATITATTTALNDQFTNTLNVKSVTGKKSWEYSYSDNGAVKTTAMTEEIWKNLYALGALPTSVALIVQKSTDDGSTWSDMSAPASGNYRITVDGKTVFGKKFDFTDNNYLDRRTKISLTIKNLPQFVKGSDTEIQYRMVEALQWKDGTWKRYDGTGDGKLNYTGSDFADETARVAKTTSNGVDTYTYTNTIPLTTLVINKEWIDGENENQARPGSITASVQINDTAKVTCTIGTTVDSSHTKGQILLPVPKAGNTAAAMNALYATITEQAIKNYIENEIPDNAIAVNDDGTFGYRFQNEFRLLEVYAKKNWTKNGTAFTDAQKIGQLVANGTLPTSLKFVLYTWVDDEEDSAVPVVVDGVEVSSTISLATLASAGTDGTAVKTDMSLPVYNADGTKNNYELREVAAIFGTGDNALTVAINADGTYTGIVNNNISRTGESSVLTAKSGNTIINSKVTGTFTNNVNTTTLTASKKWVNEATGQEMDFATFANLRTLGALPTNIAFVLQRAEVGSTSWSEVATLTPAGTYADGTAVTNVSYDIANLTAQTFQSLSATYADLPLSQRDGTRIVNYQYRIAERLTWTNADGKESTSTYYKDAASTSMQPSDGSVAAETADVTVENNAYSFTNTIPTLKIKLKKVWTDGSNALNTRITEDLGVTVTQNITGGKSVECTISPAQGDEWESGIYYLPAPVGVTADKIAEYLTNNYSLVEHSVDAAINNYVQINQLQFVNDASAYICELNNELRFSKVVLEKSWVDEDGEDIEALEDLIALKVIPDALKFRLYSYVDGQAPAAVQHVVDGVATDITTTVSVLTLAEGPQNWPIENLPVFTEGENPQRIHYVAREVGYVYGDTVKDPSEVNGVSEVVDDRETDEAEVVTTMGFVNKVETVGVSGSKTWLNGYTQQSLDFATFSRLRDLGALPYSISLVLERSTDDGVTWADIESVHGTTIDGEALTNATMLLSTATVANFQNFTASWDKLPESGEVNGVTVNYSYRVIEKLTWDAAGTDVSYYDGDAATSNQLQPANGAYAPETAALAISGSAYGYTNSIALLRIEVRKVWVDGGNLDELRPDTLKTYVNKVNSDVSVEGTLTPVTDSDDWTALGYYLPVPAQTADDYTTYLNGAYEVLEDAVNDYVQVNEDTFVKEGNIYSYTLINEQRMKEITVSKTWQSSSDSASAPTALDSNALKKLIAFGMVPDAIKFQLYSYVGDADPAPVMLNDTAVTATYGVLDLAAAAQKWAVSLPVYTADGDQIHYEAREIAYVFGTTETPVASVSGIERVENGTESDTPHTTAAASFTNTLKDTSVNASKTWMNSATDAELDPDTYKNLVKLGIMPKSITYVVQRSKDNGASWKDMEELKGIDLNGDAVKNEKLELTENLTDLSFDRSWTNLPVSANENGTVVNYKYRVVEELTWADNTTSRYGDGSDAELAPEDSDYAPEIAELTLSTDGKGYDFTNTIQLLKIKLVKVWHDNDDEDELRPEQIGTVIERKVNESVTIEGTLEAVEEGEDWTAVYYLPAPAQKLDDYTQYLKDTYGVYEDLNTATEALETAIDNYVQTNAGTFKNESGIYTYTFENEEQITTVDVTKFWSTSEDVEMDDEMITELVALGALPSAIEFKVYTWMNDAKEDAAPYKDAKGQELAVVYTYEELFDTQEINVNLPVWNSNGDRLNYEVRETALIYGEGDDAVKTPIEEDGGIEKAEETVVSYDDGNAYAVFENELMTASLMVTKEWFDQDDFVDNEELGLRPDSIKVTLYRDGEQYGETVELTKDEDPEAWAYTWTDLPVYKAGTMDLSVWTIKEEIDENHVMFYKAQPTYTPSYAEEGAEAGEDAVTLSDGETTELAISNPWVTVHVSGEKIWDDDDDRDGLRPESIEITLLGDEEYTEYPTYEVASETIIPDENNNWAWDFGDLPKYGIDGHIISYTVVEQINYPTVPDENEGIVVYATDEEPVLDEDDIEEPQDPYTITIHKPVIIAEGNEGNKVLVDVTNTHAPELINIPVQKIWDDKDNKDGSRPVSITVRLLANGVDTGKTLVLTKKNNWMGSFEDLFKYENHGTPIVYTVSEDKVKGYSTKIEGDQEKGYTITNHHTPNPKTADTHNNTNLWMVLCTAAMAVMLFVLRRRMRYCR